MGRNHPRIRGEHRNAADCEWGHRGSSPHTRGARTASSAWLVRLGIIPAYAGSTRKPAAAVCPSRDHPRIRGEHLVRGCPIASPRGSSPHTRGAPHGTRRKPATTGIIPAYAGSTTIDPWRKTRCRDHPRIRGEHSLLGLPFNSSLGSSPHTRGALPIFSDDLDSEGSSPHTRGARRPARAPPRATGIIPAYAGSTRV